MGNMMTKEELREIINPLFQNLVDKIDHMSEMFGKDIKTLFKQSAEHYNNVDSLEDKLTEKLDVFKKDCEGSLTKQGERLGNIEKNIAANTIEIENINKVLENKTAGKRFGIEIWVLIIVALAAPFLAKLLE